MATARVIPSTATDWPISIEYVDATNTMTVSPAGKIIGADDSITFINNSPDATINVTFELNPPGPTLFQPVSPASTPDIPPGDTYSPEGPSAANGSVNYYVNVVGGSTFGPYSIQTGTGPLYVSVTSGTSSPAQVAIPPGGSLEMFSTDIEYNVRWTNNGNPLPDPAPGLVKVYVGASKSGNGPYSNPTSGGPPGPLFTYEIEPSPKLTGKGTVIVTS
jgi:hypothetical protein